MKKNKLKGILIDIVILTVLTIFISTFMYYSFVLFKWSRIIYIIIFILFIPIAWGTLICSLMGKNTIGHRMVKKINGKNYKSINLK